MGIYRQLCLYIPFLFAKKTNIIHHTYRLARRWGYIGGNPFPYVVLGVGVYRGGGIETPAPIRIFATLSLREESVKKELIILR